MIQVSSKYFPGKQKFFGGTGLDKSDVRDKWLSRSDKWLMSRSPSAG